MSPRKKKQEENDFEKELGPNFEDDDATEEDIELGIQEDDEDEEEDDDEELDFEKATFPEDEEDDEEETW